MAETIAEQEPDTTAPDEPEQPDEPETTGQPDEPETPDEPEQPDQEGRCEAETTVGGTEYRCALETGHDGDHSFTPVDATDTGEPTEEPMSHEDEEQAKQLGRRARSYSKAVAELLGDDLSGWIACEVCSPYFPGLHPPFAALGGAPGDVVAACRTIAGLPALDNMRVDKYTSVCGTCGGVGRTLTGSHVQGQETIRCRDCEGKGWIPVGPERQQEHRTAPAAPASGNGDEPVEPAAETDPWGRPYGDPLYGVMPGYEHAHGA